MKYIIQILLVLLLCTIRCTVIYAQIGINTDNSAADPSAALDIKATDKGLLIPRMTSTQKGAISSPATGLLVYQTDAPEGFYEYDGSDWVLIGGKLRDGRLVAGGIVLDANQPTTNGGDGIWTSTSQWQSFTAENTGPLVEIDINYDRVPTSPTIRIYQGEGATGNPLVEQTFSGGGVGWVTYTFSTPPTLTAGQKYTLWVMDATGRWRIQIPNVYTGGVPCCSAGGPISTNYDFTFRTYVRLVEVSLLQTDLSNGSVALADSSIYIDSIGNVGIGTLTPKNKLDIEGRLAVGSSYSGSDTADINGAIIEGNVSIGTTASVNKLDVAGGVAIGSSYAGNNAITAPTNGAIIEGLMGIGTGTSPINVPLSFGATLGNKIALQVQGNDINHYGLGVQNNLLQLYTAVAQQDIAFGTGSSTQFTENMRIKGNGAVGIGTSTPSTAALLDITSTNKGLLIPRMTQAQRIAITGSAGLLVYQTDMPQGLYGHDGTDWGLIGGLSNGSSSFTTGQVVLDANQSLSNGAYPVTTNGAWQSFTALNSGLLDNIDIIWRVVAVTGPTIRIYQGEGITGTQLVSQAFAGSPALGLNEQKYTFSSPPILTAGQKYTIWVADATAEWGISTPAPYADGVPSANILFGGVGLNYDFAFRTNVAPGNYLLNTDLSSGGSTGIANNGLFVDNAGRVGIGTTTPTNGKLVVEGVGNGLGINYAYLNSAGATSTISGETNLYSIYSTGRIAASEFNAYSDARIKNSLGRSNSTKDLATLLDIQITDYQHVDTIKEGTGLHKKVIAQQVAEVYPQAVSKTAQEVIPDIYKKASLKDGWIQLATNLKVGERVKIITKTSSDLHEVIAVEKDRFKVDDKDKVLSSIPTSERIVGTTVFVYGREVTDFHTVDYEALSMLNVSATQEQQQLIEARQKELERLKNRVSQIEALLFGTKEPFTKK